MKVHVQDIIRGCGEWGRISSVVRDHKFLVLKAVSKHMRCLWLQKD